MRYSVEMWFFGADSLFRWGPSFRSMKLFHWTRCKVVFGADSLREVVPPLMGWLVVVKKYDDEGEDDSFWPSEAVSSGWLSGDFVVLDQAGLCGFVSSYFSDFCCWIWRFWSKLWMNLKTKSCLKVVKRASLVLELVELAPCCTMVSKFFGVWNVRPLEALLLFSCSWQSGSVEARFVDVPYVWATSALAIRAF